MTFLYQWRGIIVPLGFLAGAAGLLQVLTSEGEYVKYSYLVVIAVALVTWKLEYHDRAVRFNRAAKAAKSGFVKHPDLPGTQVEPRVVSQRPVPRSPVKTKTAEIFEQFEKE